MILFFGPVVHPSGFVVLRSIQKSARKNCNKALFKKIVEFWFLMMHFLLQVGSESYSLDKAFTKKEFFDFDSSSPKIIRTVIVRVSFLITQFIILWWIQTRMNWMSNDCLSSGNEMWIIFGKFYLMPEEAFIKLKLKMAGTLKPLQSKIFFESKMIF